MNVETRFRADDVDCVITHRSRESLYRAAGFRPISSQQAARYLRASPRAERFLREHFPRRSESSDAIRQFIEHIRSDVSRWSLLARVRAPADERPEPQSEVPPPETEITFLSVRLVDEDTGAPIADERYSVEGPDGSSREGNTNQDGSFYFGGVEPGRYGIRFPALDQRGMTEFKATGEHHVMERPLPKIIEARWSKSEILPDHNQSFPPQSPPRDTVPEAAKVSLIVRTKNVPDGTTAQVAIRCLKTHSLTANGQLPGTGVVGNRLIDGEIGEPPTWTFNEAHQPWEEWRHPLYYFAVGLNYRGLWASTETAEPLRVRYMDALLCDPIADQKTALHTVAEVAAIKNILEGAPFHTGIVHSLDAGGRAVLPEEWGSTVRNAYVLHASGHGFMNDDTTRGEDANFQAMEKGIDPQTLPKIPSRAKILDHYDPEDAPPPVPKPGDEGWIHVGHKPLHTEIRYQEIADREIVLTVPRYLAYLNMCLAGSDPRIANAFLQRGTQNVIAFRNGIPDTDSITLASAFYAAWVATDCDPETLPACFLKAVNSLDAELFEIMLPILYGKGPGAAGSAGAEDAANAIASLFA